MIRTTVLALAASVALQSAPAQAQDDSPFAQFSPRQDVVATSLDFSVWNTMLHWFVLRMGPSLREYAPRPDQLTGTRVSYGHDSPYRMEGNRVAFSMMTDEMRDAVVAYRRELEALPDTVPLSRLSRNDQLAYWINLHNAAVIEQLALAYPAISPGVVRVGEGRVPLDEAKFITVSGVSMSPQDIRTRIVYPNWRDPRVIYGFWHGEIGGPSLSRNAFTAANLANELDDAAREFVNSLRGVQRAGDRLQVSEHYLEAKPFFFPAWPDDLRAHLKRFSNDKVTALIDGTNAVEATLFEHDIADLTKGEKEPEYTNIVSTAGQNVDFVPSGPLGRLLAERRAKFERILREGKVTVGGETSDPGGSGVIE